MPRKKEYPVTRPMANPAHPGLLLKEEITKGLKLKIGEAAEMLDIDRTTLSRLMNGHIAMSVEMAMRLSKALNTTPNVWLGMQQAYDLAQARKRRIDLSRVQRFDSGSPHAPA